MGGTYLLLDKLIALNERLRTHEVIPTTTTNPQQTINQARTTSNRISYQIIRLSEQRDRQITTKNKRPTRTIK